MPKVGKEEFYGPDGHQRVKDKAADTEMVIEQSYSTLPGGIMNRSSGPGYQTQVEHSRGGGAARKDSTRFYKVTTK